MLHSEAWPVVPAKRPGRGRIRLSKLDLPLVRADLCLTCGQLTRNTISFGSSSLTIPSCFIENTTMYFVSASGRLTLKSYLTEPEKR